MKLRRLLPWLLVAILVLWAGARTRQVVLATEHTPWTAATDTLPLFLGAHALVKGQPPNDAAKLGQIFRELGVRGMRVGGFYSYYPPTAPLLLVPFTSMRLGELVPWWRRALLLSLGLGTAILALTGWRGPLWRRVGAVACAVGVVMSLRLALIVARTGQPSPLVVLCCAAGVAALVSRRDRLAGVVIGLGTALKILPVLLLLTAAVGRRRHPVIAAAATVGALLLVALIMLPSTTLFGSPGALVDFLTRDAHPLWLREPRWWIELWRGRIWIFGVPTAALVAWVAWRRLGEAVAGPLSVTILAFAGLVVAGTHHYHEALMLTPSLAWLLGRLWAPRDRALRGLTAIVLTVALGSSGVAAPKGPAATLHWIPVGAAIWSLCVAWTVTAARRRGGLAAG